MRPYYQDDHVTIYHGDCREIDAWLAADVLVTDPPYGVAWKPAARFHNADGVITRCHDSIAGDGDTAIRDEALALWGARPAIVFGSPMRPVPVDTRQVLVWAKAPNAGIFGAIGGWRRDWEAIYLTGQWPVQPAARSAIIHTEQSINSYATGQHPHVKPVGLLRALIDGSPHGIVADPFMGSGSTLRAAKDLGRRAIGVEIDERYCEVAANRLGQEVFDFGGAA